MALTAAGLNFLAQAVVGQGTPFNNANARIGVGNGTTEVSSLQTDLTGSSTIRKAMDAGFPTVSNASIRFRATFEPSEANFAWNEWGIFNDATGGVMLSRVVESNGTKQSNQTWVLDIAITLHNTDF